MKQAPQPFSRRDFLRVAGLSFLGLGLDSLLSACSHPTVLADIINTEPLSAAPTNPPSAAPLSAQPAVQPPPPEANPANSIAIQETVPLTARDVRRLELIERYGTATRALPLEFHGDEYWFFNGAYCMDPKTFTWLMGWFQENEVWAVSADELLGFLDGSLQLPARSVILTTDSGKGSVESLERMIPVLQDTGMHFISLIWTMQMLPEESAACPDNLCWDQFNKAKDSGVFSFGTHSEYHVTLGERDQQFGFKDISQSIQEIEEHLGITPEVLAWPNESCPSWGDRLSELGIRAAFGGRSRPLAQCSVYAQDPLPYCLPRLFPPNRQTRRSGRPDGMTIEELASNYMDGFES